MENIENLILISGSDDAAVLTTAKKMVEKLVGPDPDPFVFDLVRETDDITPPQALDQAIRSVLSPSFMGGNKTVWLKDFSGVADEKKTGPLGRSLESLYQLLDKGVPDDVCFIISGPGVDKRKRLFKTVKKNGRVVLRDKPDSKARGWEQQVAERIQQAAAERSCSLDQDALQCLVDVIGTDTTRIAAELDKLAAYVGGESPRITLDAVKTMCRGEGETVWWAVKDAVGARKVRATLRITEEYLRGERDEDGALFMLVRQIGHFFREMLQTRVAMRQLGARHPGQLQSTLKNMDKESVAKLCEQGLDFMDKHPFRVFKTAEAAMNYSEDELIHGLQAARDAYWKCISHVLVSNRVVWENLLYTAMGRKKK